MNFYEVDFVFSFVACAFGHMQEIIAKSSVVKLIVLGLTLRSLIHFELIGAQPPLLHVGMRFSQLSLLKRLSVPHGEVLASSSKVLSLST